MLIPLRFAALDGWRGLCACLIVLHHFAPATGLIGASPIIINGFLFVDFFFVLSGFIGAHVHRPRLQRTEELVAYIKARFLRLWPLHALLLGLLAVLEVARSAIGGAMGAAAPAFSGHFPLSTLPSQILFLESLGFHNELTWNAPSWASAAEFLTAIVFGLICVGLPARYFGWAAAAISACALMLIALFSPRTMSATYNLGFVRCCADFFCGVFSYELWRRLTTHAHSPGRGWATLLEAAVIAIAVAFVATSGETAVSLLAPLVFGLVVSVFATERGWIGAAFRYRGLQSLGAWSYAIYLLQVPFHIVVYFVFRLIQKLTGAGGWTSGLTLDPAPQGLMVAGLPHALRDLPVFAFLVLLIIVARLCHRYVELSFNVKLQRMSPQ